MRYLSGFLLLSFCLSVGQTHAQRKKRPVADSVTRVFANTIVVSAPKGLPPYQASATREWEIRNTRVALNFDWNERTANVKEWIQLHPYAYTADSVVLDAKGVRIDGIQLLEKGTKKSLQFTCVNDKLTIRLKRKYSSSEMIELYLVYTAQPYKGETGGSAAIQDDRGLYFINTDRRIPHKPSQIWTQGETESNSHWMITIDKPNSRFTTQIELTVPDTMTTLSNGALVKQVKGAHGTRTDIWRMDKPIQAYVVMFAIGKYAVVKDHWKDKEVNYYVEPEYGKYAKQIFKHTPEMIDFFSKATGVLYPWNKYSQIVARDYVSGAMENTSATLFGEFMNQDDRELADKNSEDVVSHELFHQWFGDYVTCESWTNITVNESFANYGEQLWREFKYGKDDRDRLAWDDFQKYLEISRLRDLQLVRFYYDSREEVFDRISYNKGGAVLHYLNSLLGNEVFNKAMNIYLTKNALRSAEAHNWRLAVEEASGKDWNWFFNEWYYHAGHPVLKINYAYDDAAGKCVVTLAQAQEDSPFVYKLPIRTAVFYGSERNIVDWDINRRRDTFTYAYKNGVRPVIIPDYDRVVPCEIRENKTGADWLNQFKCAEYYVSKRIALANAMNQMSDESSQALIDLALRDTSATIRQATLTGLQKVSSDKYKKMWLGKVMGMAAKDKDRHVRAEAFDVIAEWKSDEGKQLAIAAIRDSSYAIAGNALGAVGAIDKDTAYLLAKAMVNTNPKGNLKYAVWSQIAQQGDARDIDLFEHYGPYEQGTKKGQFCGYLNAYLRAVKTDEVFSRAIALFSSFITFEERRSTRVALINTLALDAKNYGIDVKSDNELDARTGKMRHDIILAELKRMAASETNTSVSEHLAKVIKEQTLE